MKPHPLRRSLLLVLLLCALPGCAEKVYGRVHIDDRAYDLQVKECAVADSQGVYTLSIELVDPAGSTCNSIRFTVQDPDNDRDNLLTEGAHPATGAQWDGIRFQLLESCNGYYHNQVTADEMEIVWEQLSLETVASQVSYHKGEGQIRIKRPIKVSFPDFPHTYPEQQVYFACEWVRVP